MKRWMLWIIGSVVVLVVAGILLTPVLQVGYHSNRATTAQTEGRLSDAILELQAALAVRDDPEVRHDLALLYQQQGNYGRAEYHLNQALQARPSRADWICELSALYLLQDKILDAVALLDAVADPILKAELDAKRPPRPLLSTLEEAAASYAVTVSSGSGELYATNDGSYPSLAHSPLESPASLPLTGLETRIMAVAIADGLPSPLTEYDYYVESADDVLVFTDRVIEALVREKLGKPVGALIRRDLESFTEFSNESVTGVRQGFATLDDLLHMPNLKDLILIDGGDCDVSAIGRLPNLKTLSLTGFQLDAVDLLHIGKAATLDTLNLTNNGLITIAPLSGLTNLRFLSLANNRISDIRDLRYFTKLSALDLSDNRLSELPDLTTLTELTNVKLHRNNLRRVDGLPLSVERLNLSENLIYDISGLAGLNHLTHLYLSRNAVEDIAPLSGCTTLQELSLSGNKVTVIDPLSSLPQLVNLNLSGNQISVIGALSALPQLASLNLSENRIGNLEALADAPILTTLNVARNPLSTLSAAAKIATLDTLDVSYNRISDLTPLKDAAALRILYASHNRITDPAPILGNAALLDVYLAGNPVPYDKRESDTSVQLHFDEVG